MNTKEITVVVNGKSVVKDPKTESGRRTVDVPAQLIQKLSRHKTNCIANRLRMGRNYTASSPASRTKRKVIPIGVAFFFLFSPSSLKPINPLEN